MTFTIGENCKIHPTAIIDIKEGHIGDRTIIEANVVIEGNKIIIGKESFFGRNASIGGSSCFDKEAYLIAGDWLHVGMNTHINISCGVDIGNEVAFGMDSKLFTHSSYIDSYALGFKPQWKGVKIGNNAFLASVHINPGIEIGNNVVVSARSVINKNLPDNCFAAGNPIKILRENFLPKPMSIENKTILINNIIKQTKNRYDIGIDDASFIFDNINETIIINSTKGQTIFDLINRQIFGLATESSKALKDQLRRNGIRFKYKEVSGLWTSW